MTEQKNLKCISFGEELAKQLVSGLQKMTYHFNYPTAALIFKQGNYKGLEDRNYHCTLIY